MGVKLMYVFASPNVYKSMQLCTEICFSSLDVSETFVSGVSSMYNVIVHYLNSFLSSLIINFTVASLTCLFTIKIDVFPFLQVLIPAVVFFHESNY